MLYVFIDESGDLGFTEKSTKYYVIASVETRNLLGLTRVIKKVRKTLGKKKKNIPEFKLDSYEGSNPPKIEITHEDSQQHPGLQIADFVAGAVFQIL